MAFPILTLPTTSGLGKIAGVVKRNGFDILDEITLIDEALDLRIDIAVGSTFTFKGLSLTRTYTLIARNLASNQYSPLAYDKINTCGFIKLLCCIADKHLTKSTLTSIFLNGHDLTNKTAQILAGIESLVSLEIEAPSYYSPNKRICSGRITDEGINAFLDSKNISRVALINHRLTSDSCLKRLKIHLELNQHTSTITKQFNWGSGFDFFAKPRTTTQKTWEEDVTITCTHSSPN